MIPRITRGTSGYGALSYDHGPGRRDEHTNAHKVGGNIAGSSWKQRASAMDDHVSRMQPKLTKPIIRTSLRLAPEDRALTDKEWRSIAEQYVEKMGYGSSPWEAVRHADDHIHLTMSRVRWDGTVVDQWQDKNRAQRAVRGIERDHGLIDASRRYNRDVPQLSRNDVERAQRASELSGRSVDPEKRQLRDRVSAAEKASGGTRAGFERELTEQGVMFRANVSGPTERNPHGKMNGYSYRLPGHTDADGQPVWFKASKLGQRYGWAQTERRLEDMRTGSAPSAEVELEQRREATDDATARNAQRAPHEHERDTVAGGDDRKRGDKDDRARSDEESPRAAAEADDEATNDRTLPEEDRPRSEAAQVADRHDDRATDGRQKAGESEKQTRTAVNDDPARRQQSPGDDRHTRPERDERRDSDDSRAQSSDRAHTDRTTPQIRTQEPDRRDSDTETGRSADRPAEPRGAAEQRPHTRPDTDRSSRDGNDGEQRTGRPAEDRGGERNDAGRTSRERAQRWAEQRRHNADPRREQDTSPDRARVSGDDRRRQGRDGPRADDRTAVPTGSVDDRNQGADVVRNGKDERHSDSRAASRATPEQSGHKEGSPTVSKSQKQDMQRTAKEASRERAEKWSQERQERGRDNDRDRGPERNR